MQFCIDLLRYFIIFTQRKLLEAWMAKQQFRVFMVT